MNTSGEVPTELLIARAFVKLALILPESSEAVVTLASVGTCEIRMLLSEPSDLDNGTLFWLELVDHAASTSIDSFRCLRVRDAAPVFEDFMSQAAGLNNAGRGGAETN
jgi:hypothetical protein